MSEEESKRHDALFDQAAKLKDEIKKEERLIELERETADEELRTLSQRFYAAHVSLSILHSFLQSPKNAMKKPP